MSLFLLTYLTAYGVMTAFAGWRLQRGLGGSWRLWLPLGLFAVVMMFLPVLLRLVEPRLGLWSGRVLTGAGWIWLALVFWAFSAFLGLEVWNGLLWVLGRAYRPFQAAMLTPLAAARGVLVLLPVLCLWGWVEGGWVRLRTVVIESDRVPAGTPPVRVVQIADMHLGHTTRPRVWRRVLRLVAEAEPDLVVSSGDLIDHVDSVVDGWLAEMAPVTPPLGKVAILGNHEFYPGVERCIAALRAGGWVVLRNAAMDVTPGLRVVGLDDHLDGRSGGEPDEDEILPPPRDGVFTLLLKHRPEVTAAARERCDLQLSGHSHGGQIFPFGWAVQMVYLHPHGRLVTFPEGLRLYVSHGTGTWGPPFRLFAPPELTLFVVRPSARPAAPPAEPSDPSGRQAVQ